MYHGRFEILIFSCASSVFTFGIAPFLWLGLLFVARIEEHNGNQEILSEPLRVLALPDGMLLVTLDDETVSEPAHLKSQGSFVIVCKNISYREIPL